MTIYNFGREDFQGLLAMWGRASVGVGCKLGYSSGHVDNCEQFDLSVVERVEKAMLSLRVDEPGLYDLLHYRYVCREPRTLLELRFKFGISERQIAQLVRDGESLVRGYYGNFSKAA